MTQIKISTIIFTKLQLLPKAIFTIIKYKMMILLTLILRWIFSVYNLVNVFVRNDVIWKFNVMHTNLNNHELAHITLCLKKCMRWVHLLRTAIDNGCQLIGTISKSGLDMYDRKQYLSPYDFHFKNSENSTLTPEIASSILMFLI